MKDINWIKSTDGLPEEGENVEVSDDGITVRETADYKRDRVCMMAGMAGGNGYFSTLGFATDGTGGCDSNLILDTPTYWRRRDSKMICDTCIHNIHEADGGDGYPANYCRRGHWSDYGEPETTEEKELLKAIWEDCADYSQQVKKQRLYDNTAADQTSH